MPSRAIARIEVPMDELQDVLRRLRAMVSARDYELLEHLVHSYTYLTTLVEATGTTIATLRRLLFGATSEKTRTVFAGAPPAAPGA
ncbi:MAG: hypothetical protein ACREMC_05960, partial [Gemmatimonadales bacterium]